MNVDIHGPNLRDQSKGTFNVHAAGCKDSVNRRRYPEDPWQLDVGSRREVVEEIYPRNQFEWDVEDYYFEDVWFAPCLKDLPKEVVG